MASSDQRAQPQRPGRREFIKSSAMIAAVGVSGRTLAQSTEDPTAPGARAMKIRLTVNGQQRELNIDTRVTLLDALREHLALTGSKKGCDHGQCGACTVMLEGRRINACLTLAVMHDGQSVTTVEGLASGDSLSPLQSAFIHHDGFQCGYCTSGQLCSATGMLEEVRDGMPSVVTADLASKPVLTSEEIRERMSGNLCRCSAYPNIVAAIADVGGARS
jgi:xanthine dehydrogenase YagT iron-sulfur-binding subunit